MLSVVPNHTSRHFNMVFRLLGSAPSMSYQNLVWLGLPVLAGVQAKAGGHIAAYVSLQHHSP